MKTFFWVTAVVAIVCIAGGSYYFLSALQAKKEAAYDTSKPLVIAWAKWAPSDYLQELSKDFTKETGIPVVVVQTPWDNFQTATFDVFAKKGNDFDMVVGDSQWLGEGSRNGDYVELTDFIKSNNIDKTMHPTAVEGYGEYPKGSGRYWAIPLEGDAMGWAYRKDLFENTAEKKAFKDKYGYDLAVPKTWDQVRNIAAFFYRPSKGFYGIGFPTSEPQDTLTMSLQNMIWAYGGNLGDYKTHKVQGILNSKESIAGLELAKDLYQYMPPGYDSASYTQPVDDFKAGKIPMFFTYFAFMPELEDPKTNPLYDSTGYFVMPAGPVAQVASLGGQGLSINSYSTKKDEALAFARWLIRDDVQKKWAELGGFSVSLQVLRSNEFLEHGARFNPVFARSMDILKDFWSDPVYPDLLELSEKEWHAYLTTNTLTAVQVMDKLATEWENIFESNGYYRE